MSVFSRREPAVPVLDVDERDAPQLSVDRISVVESVGADTRSTSSELTPEQMLGLAAELLRAQRDDDRRAFTAAMNRAGGRTAELLVSMAFLANRHLEATLGPAEATDYLEHQSRSSPVRPPRPGPEPEARWRDAVAMADAVATGRSRDAMLLLIDAPDETALFRDFLHVFAALAAVVPPETLERTIDHLRSAVPPSG